MIRISMVLIEVILLLFFLSGTQSAYATDESVIPILEQPIEKKIIEEEIYPFIEQTYDPPFELQITRDMTKVTNLNPEDAFALHYSSLLQGNTDLRLKVMTENDRKEFNNKTKEEQFNEITKLKKQVEVLLKGRRIVLYKKMSIGNSYVILDHCIQKLSDGKIVYEFPVPLELENKQWKISRKWTEDKGHGLYPFMLNRNYRFPGIEQIIKENKTNTPEPSSLLWKGKKIDVK